MCLIMMGSEDPLKLICMSSAMRRLTNSLTKSTAAFRRRLSPLCLNIAIATALTA